MGDGAGAELIEHLTGEDKEMLQRRGGEGRGVNGPRGRAGPASQKQPFLSWQRLSESANG